MTRRNFWCQLKEFLMGPTPFWVDELNGDYPEPPDEEWFHQPIDLPDEQSGYEVDASGKFKG